jgi:hypothetical protein
MTASASAAYYAIVPAAPIRASRAACSRDRWLEFRDAQHATGQLAARRSRGAARLLTALCSLSVGWDGVIDACCSAGIDVLRRRSSPHCAKPSPAGQRRIMDSEIAAAGSRTAAGLRSQTPAWGKAGQVRFITRPKSRTTGMRVRAKRKKFESQQSEGAHWQIERIGTDEVLHG